MTAENKELMAKGATTITLLGVWGKLPLERGNCFSVETEQGDFRIVNFVHENLEHLLKHGLSWPIRIMVLGDGIAALHDERIPDRWFSKTYCEVCCPQSLLPFPQRAAHMRQEARGERKVRTGFISFDPSKKPTEPPEGVV